MSPDSFSSWEVRCTLHKSTTRQSPQRGSGVFVREKGCCCVQLVLCFLSDRDMLHNLPLHMCGWDQLWTVPLSPLHVWHTRGHQSWLRLVHVLCVGRPGSHVACRLPVHTGSFSLPSTNPCCAKAQAGERLCVTRCPTSYRHLSHPETVMSPVPETLSTRDSEQRAFTQLGTGKAQDTGSHTHKPRREVTFDWRRFQFLWCFGPSSWLNCSVLLLAFQKENNYKTFLPVRSTSLRRGGKKKKKMDKDQ